MTQKNNNCKHFAVLDLGSSALRMDIYQWVSPESTTINLINKFRALPRLGDLIDNKIQEGPLIAVENALCEFKNKLKSCSGLKITACGTAVFRKACNSDEVVQRISEALGEEFRIIEGIEEAKLITEGILAFDRNIPTKPMFLDIGAGSSEISYYNQNNEIYHHSIPIGALSLFNSHFSQTSEINEGRINRARLEIRQHLSSFFEKLNPEMKSIVGSSGTLRALRYLYKKHTPSCDEEEVPLEYLDSILSELLSASSKDIKEYLGIEAHRFDLIVGGMILLKEVVDFYSIKNIYITTYSLRHGLLRKLIIDELDVSYISGNDTGKNLFKKRQWKIKQISSL
jgi:exopolyphosphatase / guanosine-5'-triphosphate,3'-diphosphate pyrophosphatase